MTGNGQVILQNKTMMTKYFIGFYISSLLIACTSKLVTHQLPLKNPTSYVYHFSKQILSETIKSEFSLRCFKGMKLYDFYSNEGAQVSDSRFGKDTLAQGDFILENFHMSIDTSMVYTNQNNTGYPYLAKFYLQLVSIDSNSTLIKVLTIDPEIIYGTSLSYVHSFSGANKYKKVLPTTTEEYQILLKIGLALGIENEMPKLQIPKD
jgi:hypothetical protein